MGKNLPSQDLIMPWKGTLAFIYKTVLYRLSGSEYIDISIVYFSDDDIITVYLWDLSTVSRKK